jgi:hypothetical protein
MPRGIATKDVEGHCNEGCSKGCRGACAVHSMCPRSAVVSVASVKDPARKELISAAGTGEVRRHYMALTKLSLLRMNAFIWIMSQYCVL